MSRSTSRSTSRSASRSGPMSNSLRYYDIFGVSKSVGDEELKTAYADAMIKYDADNGGDAEKLKEAALAYQVLSNHKKRRIYDEYGEDGLKEMDDDSESEAADRRRKRKKTGDIYRSVEVSLEELYIGGDKRVEHLRGVICGTCMGQGSKSGPIISCLRCDGTGKRTPQSSLVCHKCRGTGIENVASYRCNTCKGAKIVTKTEVIWIDVKKVMNNNTQITVEGLAEEQPNMITGDLIILLKVNNHPKFLRNGADLFYYHTLPLSGSFFGYKFLLTHLDGRILMIESPAPHQIIQPESYGMIKNEGMPFFDEDEDEGGRGNLYIHFKVELPTTLTEEEHQILMNMFPPNINELTEIDVATRAILHLDINNEEIRRREAEAAADRT